MNVVAGVRLLSGLLWLVAIVLFLVWLRGRRGTRIWLWLTPTLGALALSLLSVGMVFIPPEERGVVISALAPKGYREQPLGPGLHWIVPYFEYVARYPIAKQTYTMSRIPQEGQRQGDDAVEARTRDGQRIFIDASVIYSIDPEQVIQVHITWQNRYAEDLVRPLTRGIIRDVVSQYRVDEVLSTHRFELERAITRELEKKLAENGLRLYDFVLRDIEFTPEYAQAVEQKQIAEQQALQAKFLVEKKKQEAEQLRQQAQGEADARIIRAKAEAEAKLIEAQAEAKALEVVAQVLRDNPELLMYLYIQKIAPGVQVMLLPNNMPFLLPLPPLQPGTPAVPVPTPTPAP